MPLNASTRTLALALLISGCGRSVVLPDAGDAAADARCREPAREVDLLFMVDDSNCTFAEQQALSEQFERVVAVLASGDVDADGAQDFPPIASLQIGVVTSDMGVGTNSVYGCDQGELGRDGVLRTEGEPLRPGCDREYPRFLEFVPESDPSAGLADLRCVASVGTAGCGFEQPLEAMLKAVAPSTALDSDGSPLRFYGESTGHGDGVNAGFVREGAILVLVAMTDEDDCSAADPELYDMESDRYPGEYARRCTEHPEALHPITRYANGFASLKSSPSEVVFVTLVGIPRDLEGEPYATLLADPRLEQRVDTTMGPNIIPSCDAPGMGPAFPPRRLLEVGEALERVGAFTVATSVCTDDFSGAFDAILERIAQSVSGECP